MSMLLPHRDVIVMVDWEWNTKLLTCCCSKLVQNALNLKMFMSAVSLFSQSDNSISQSITVDETKRGLLFIVILTSQDPRNRDGGPLCWTRASRVVTG